MLALLGVNGAGKTTTIRMLSGLSAPSEGTAEIFGMDIRKEKDAIKALTGISPQDTAVAENLTVRENLTFMAEICRRDEQISPASGGSGTTQEIPSVKNEGLQAVKGFTRSERKKEIRGRVEEILKAFHLEEVRDKRAKTLSGGFKRRLSIAMAVIGRPKILYLDEPTLGLDVLARRSLWQEIEKLKDQMTILLTTHYMEEAEALADRIAIMIEGKLVHAGTLRELEELTGKKGLEEVFVHVAESTGSYYE